jgi:hypothetical protein
MRPRFAAVDESHRADIVVVLRFAASVLLPRPREHLMKTILVANATYSSAKFQVFAIDGGGKLPRAPAT